LAALATRSEKQLSRRFTSILVLAVVLAALLLLAPDVLLTVFAGILFAVLLHEGGRSTGSLLRIGEPLGIGLFVLCIVLMFAGFGMAVAPAVTEQVSELSRRIPEALDAFRQRVEEYPGGSEVMDRLIPDSLNEAQSRSAAMSAVSSTFGALGTFAIIIAIGVYGALDPGLYRRGLTLLLAPSIRDRGDHVLRASAGTLRNWLVAQLIAMSAVGSLTTLGLWLAGVPLAFALGLIAGLLAFIPNIGPIIAIAPALLLALPEGLTTVLVVLTIYIGVQTLESYVITPLVQQEKVSLQPALVISTQLLFGVLFGMLGLMLATPIAAVLMTIVRMIYVEDYLEKEGCPRNGKD
jgi:predicted PurR-regulated permease PerM